VKLAALRRLAHHAPDLALFFGEHGLPLGADIPLVSPDRGFLAVQQLVPDPAVMDPGRRNPAPARSASSRP
jgi:hypothetical protein